METILQKRDNDQNPKGAGGHFFKPVIQAKLTVNQPGDRYEQEADHMADKVMRMTDNSIAANTFFKSTSLAVQRKCQACEEEDKHVRRKENNLGDIGNSSELNSYVNSLGTSGQPMSAASRSFFEPRFGRDFSNVKLHTDTVAAKSAQSINALAYTTGNNIVFNSGQYSPDSDSGKKLMAHELTHVVQQSTGEKKLQKLSVNPIGNLTTGTCGQYSKTWDFILGAPATEDGYIVQKVDFYENLVNCPGVGSSATAPTITFWEAWPVLRGATSHQMRNAIGYTDRSAYGAKPNKSGSVAAMGEIKFFLKSVTGNLGSLNVANPGSGWAPGNQGGVSQSGSLPSTTTAPAWWGQSVEGPVRRSANSDWSCCGGASDFNTITATP